MKDKICCICGRTIIGWGNNPWGVLDSNNKPIEWKDTDYCCNDCNNKFVIPGRMFIMSMKNQKNKKEGK